MYVCNNDKAVTMIPRISVIIPSFKPDKYIDDCLKSLAVQTLPKDSYEVIVILNGCNEPWKTRIDALLTQLKNDYALNSELFRTDMGNVSNARNIGIDNAKGEYICFVDDDDYVSETYLEQLLAKADKDTVSLCRPVSFMDGTNERLPYCIAHEYDKRSPHGRQPFYKAKKYFQGPCMKMIHRDIIGDRRFDIRFSNGEDSMFMFLISDRIRWIEYAPQDAVYYRRIRKGSAQSAMKDRKKRYQAAWNKMRMFSKYYFSAPFRYNFLFYITRMLAGIKTIIG